MGELKKNYLVLIISMILAVGSSLLIQSFSKINDSASKEYVDTGDSKLDSKIEAQRLEIDENLQKKADESTVKEMKETLKIIDGRIYDIWKDSHENK